MERTQGGKKERGPIESCLFCNQLTMPRKGGILWPSCLKAKRRLNHTIDLYGNIPVLWGVFKIPEWCPLDDTPASMLLQVVADTPEPQKGAIAVSVCEILRQRKV